MIESITPLITRVSLTVRASAGAAASSNVARHHHFLRLSLLALDLVVGKRHMTLDQTHEAARIINEDKGK